MSYLGRQPLVGNYQVLDAIVATTTDTYALTKDTVAVFPQTPSNCIVSLNGVIQAPVSSYTISGSNIVFDSALTGSDSIDFITVLGDVLSIGTPTDGTVTTAKLVDSSVTTAKLNDGSVSLAKLTATGTKDATTFLRGDNSFQAVPAGGITEADMFRLTVTITANVDPIAANLERVDDATFAKIGTGVTNSSGIFSFATTGLYLITTRISGQPVSNDNIILTTFGTADNGSSYDTLAQNVIGADTNAVITGTNSTFFNCTNVSTHKVKFAAESLDAGSEMAGDTNSNGTTFQFIRLGDSQ